MNRLRGSCAVALGMLRGERRLAAITGSIVGSNLVTSAIGVVFWMLAARGLAPAPLGTLGAATSAMGFIGLVGTMGLGPLLIGELPRTPQHRRWELFAVSMTVAVVVGAVLGGLFGGLVGGTGAADGTWAPLRAPGAAWWWFTLGTALTAVAGVLDQAMLVVGNPAAQVVRNTVASVWKVAVLAVALAVSAVDVTLALAAWATGLAAATVVAVRAAARQLPGERWVPVRSGLAVVRRHALPALGHQGVNVALSASSMAMPALIAWVVPPVENGVYTAVRLAAGLAFLLPYALSVSLFAASAGDQEYDVERSRRVLNAALAISVALYVAFFVLGHLVLLLFGARYADVGVGYLRVMALACPLLVFKDQFIAQARLRRSVGSIVPLVVASAVLEIGLVLLGALRYDLMGALVGWLVALALEAGYVAPKLGWLPGRGEREGPACAPSVDEITRSH